MKVNTDGILLGASADVVGVDQILDLGTGTGLVAVMLAQRTADTTQITALELDSNAYQQAVENCQILHFLTAYKSIKVMYCSIIC
ncbi:type 12 methyltransferase [Actinobacillus equuli]|nr:type 12 methyltransferase [Actinobacillus equuli]